jgi:hypothetical protein
MERLFDFFAATVAESLGGSLPPAGWRMLAVTPAAVCKSPLTENLGA